MKKIISTMVNGVLFAIPLGLLIYVFGKLLVSLERLVSPLAEDMGVQRLLGEFTLTILAILLFLLFCFILGYLLQKAAFLSLVSETLEGFAVRFLPSLSFLKSMANEKFDLEAGSSWKGILLQEDDGWVPAFLVEENEQWLTLFFPEPPKGDSGGVRIYARGSANYIQIGLTEVISSLRVYGSGLIGLIPGEGAGASPEPEETRHSPE